MIFLPTAREGNVFRSIYQSFCPQGSASRSDCVQEEVICIRKVCVWGVCLVGGDLLPQGVCINGEGGLHPWGGRSALKGVSAHPSY